MSRVSIKTYILFAIVIILTTAITYYSINYNIKFLVPWSLAGLFFLLWRFRSIRSTNIRKSKDKKVKRLL
jgi:hypothetical protein